MHQLLRVNSKASTIKQTALCDYNTFPLSPTKYSDTWQKQRNNSHRQHWEGETEGFNGCSSPAVQFARAQGCAEPLQNFPSQVINQVRGQRDSPAQHQTPANQKHNAANTLETHTSLKITFCHGNHTLEELSDQNKDTRSQMYNKDKISDNRNTIGS